MKKVDEKNIFRLKSAFPDIEVALLGVYFYFACVCIYKFAETKEFEYIWLLFVLIVVSVAFGLLFNNSRKSLTITSQKIIIQKWITREKFEFEIKKIKGYDLKENYSRYGLVKHVRVIVDDKLKFEFIKDNYSNYDRLTQGLKVAKLQFLGTTELKSKYKHALKLVTVISSAVAILLFLLLQLLKVFE